MHHLSRQSRSYLDGLRYRGVVLRLRALNLLLQGAAASTPTNAVSGNISPSWLASYSTAYVKHYKSHLTHEYIDSVMPPETASHAYLQLCNRASLLGGEGLKRQSELLEIDGARGLLLDLRWRARRA